MRTANVEVESGKSKVGTLPFLLSPFPLLLTPRPL